MELLQLNELPEALAWLHEQTGEEWTASRFLEYACRSGTRLHAAPPLDASYDIWVFEAGGMRKALKGLGWAMALLHPIHIAQLQQCKQTETVHVAGHDYEDRYSWFSEPVRVTLDNLRISENALASILSYRERRRRLHGQPERREESFDDGLDKLFDPVTVANLEKMFPADGKWKTWAERAARNGLREAAKAGRAKFNPYRAAMWFLDQGEPGFDLARCMRKLANNLPERSSDKRHLLSGDIE